MPVLQGIVLDVLTIHFGTRHHGAEFINATMRSRPGFIGWTGLTNVPHELIFENALHAGVADGVGDDGALVRFVVEIVTLGAYRALGVLYRDTVGIRVGATNRGRIRAQGAGGAVLWYIEGERERVLVGVC